jgi:hypothetical protein
MRGRTVGWGGMEGCLGAVDLFLVRYRVLVKRTIQ